MIVVTPGPLQIGSRTFDWGGRTYVMGIINVSPESFSGDGLRRISDAVKQAERFAEEGADILDVGGQSTRPGFEEISVAAEIKRVVPVIERIVKRVDLPVSVDAYRCEVAKAALDAGAEMVNDIWGLRRDPALAVLAARRGVPVVVMHNQRGREFEDVIGDIRRGFEAGIKIAERSGLARDRLILDPGFGFGWTAEQNLEMLRRLGELRALGLPLLIGTLSQVHDRRRPRRPSGRRPHLRHRRHRCRLDNQRRRHRPRPRRRRDGRRLPPHGRHRPPHAACALFVRLPSPLPLSAGRRGGRGVRCTSLWAPTSATAPPTSPWR